jgi:hypothetical protein
LVTRVNDHVIQRLAFAGALKFDALNRRPRQAPWLGTYKHRQKVMGPHLTFELGTTRTSRCRT